MGDITCSYCGGEHKYLSVDHLNCVSSSLEESFRRMNEEFIKMEE